MTSEEFVKAIKEAVVQSASDGIVQTLRKPPGRRPPEIERRLSDWYANLPSEDQENIAAVVARACDLATYSFLAVLDGIKTIESIAEKGTLELFYDSIHERTRINDPTKEPLTSLFKSD